MRKGWKRIHRLVVLPDYQGIGIGVKFINEVSKYYIDKGFDMNLTTTTPALVYALARSKKWVLIRKGRNKSSMADFVKYGKGDKEKNKKISESTVKTQSNNRITYSFVFIK
jgi:GNAT superfamily N-acetyltransferase